MAEDGTEGEEIQPAQVANAQRIWQAGAVKRKKLEDPGPQWFWKATLTVVSAMAGALIAFWWLVLRRGP